MTDLHRLELGSVAIREDAEGDGRTITGYAVRWGEETDIGATREFPDAAEAFAPGSFAGAIAARQGRPFPYLDRHSGTVVGGVTFTEDELGLRFDGRLLGTPAADAYRETVAVADGVSLEFLIGQVRRKGRTVTHTAVRRIAGLAGVYAAAHQGATVALREDAGGINVEEITTGDAPEGIAERAAAVSGALALTPAQITRLATDAATEAMRGFAESGRLQSGPADPLAGFLSIGELWMAAAARDADPELRGYAARALASRALDDIVFTSGANAGLASGNLVTSEVKRIVNAGRPAITAFGGPSAIGDIAGTTLEWPYFDGTLSDFVGAQSAEKAAVTSGTLDVKLATEALVTYAGASDISYQVLRRSRPSVLDAYARVMLAAWAAVTDAAFVTELETGTVTVDFAEALSAVDVTELTAHIIDGSIAVQAASGRPAEFVLASTTAFTKAAKLIAPSSTAIAAPGGMDLRGLAIAVGNVPIIHAPGVTAGKLIISNSLAATWYEDGPFQAAAEDIEKLGRNVAYWSMGAGARFIPAAIVEAYDVTP